VSYEASTGRDIMADAVVGGAAGAGFGGLVTGGLTASVIDALKNSDDRIIRTLFGSPRMRRGSIATMGVLGAAAGGAAGFTLGGGSRWMVGRPRPVEKRGMPQLARVRGLPTQFRTAASVAPAAAPAKMKLPSTMARDHNAAGMVTKKIAEDQMRYVKTAEKDPDATAGQRFARGAGLAGGIQAVSAPSTYKQVKKMTGSTPMAAASTAAGVGLGAVSGGLTGLIVGQGEKGEGRRGAAVRGAKRMGALSGGVGAIGGAIAGGVMKGPVGAIGGALAGGTIGAASGAISGGLYGAASKRWSGKKKTASEKVADGPTSHTGTVGDSSAAGLFSTTAQALLDRSPASTDEVLADSDAYNSLPKTAYRYVRA